MHRSGKVFHILSPGRIFTSHNLVVLSDYLKTVFSPLIFMKLVVFLDKYFMIYSKNYGSSTNMTK